MSTPQNPGQPGSDPYGGPPTETPHAPYGGYTSYVAYPYPAYPTPPPQRSWTWLWIVLGIGGAILFVATLVGLVLAVSEPYPEEEDYYVDQASVTKAVRKPCRDIRDAAENVVLFGPPAEGVSTLRVVVDRIRDVATAVDTAQPGADARAWRDDLVELTEALDTFIAGRADGNLDSFDYPDSGMAARMYVGSPTDCEIPLVIEALDPANR